MRNPISISKAIVIGTISALMFSQIGCGYKIAVLNDIHADLNYNPGVSGSCVSKSAVT